MKHDPNVADLRSYATREMVKAFEKRGAIAMRDRVVARLEEQAAHNERKGHYEIASALAFEAGLIEGWEP